MSKFSKHQKLAYLFLLPQLLVTLFFFIWPAWMALRQSFFYSDAFGIQERFAGFGNYWDLFQDPDYLEAIAVTFLMTFAITICTMSAGLLLALLLRARTCSQAWYKNALLWPYAVAPAVAAMLWRFLAHPSLGWLSKAAAYWGLHFNYLTNPKQALALVIIAASWQQLSYNFLFYFAALKLIPAAIIEAARLDGASAWRRFWQIKLPLLAPTSFFLLIMNCIYAFFDTFGIIQVLSNGGPGHSTTSLIFKVYQDGFVGMDPGGSSAQSVMLMLIVIGLTLLQFRYLEQRIHYQ